MKRKIDENDNINENENENLKKKQKIDDNCPICYEVMGHKNYIITNCNHKFCFDCLTKSCQNKNECPLCRAEIENLKCKKLPLFRNIDLFDNICDSLSNPAYNIFNHIDEMKNKIFDSIINFKDIFTEEENEFKELILDKLKSSEILSNLLDLSLLDNTNLFVNEIIIRNTFNMIKWYEMNY
jgi:hypothetical protein|tara:strand:- start:254 stop:799 length:546 start_codon:yes stop_codon:yes gene_type:complete